MTLKQIAGHCDDGRTCPKVFEADTGTIIVQGSLVHDLAVLGHASPGRGEALVALPRDTFLEAARRALEG